MDVHHYYSIKELREMGFRSLGKHVLICRNCQIYSPETISIGDNVLVDDYVVMNGDITLGRYDHIGSHSALYAGEKGKIIFDDFSGCASHVGVYAVSNDYIGTEIGSQFLPEQDSKYLEEDVIVEKYVIIGSHSVVLPGVRLREGCSIGALSLVNKSTRPWWLYVGRPIKRLCERDKTAFNQQQKPEMEK